MATGCLFLMVSREFTAVLFAAGVFGCGYGAFTAVDWALATGILCCVRWDDALTAAGSDLLEDDKEYAKDMAVWGIAMVLPNLAMPLVLPLSQRCLHGMLTRLRHLLRLVGYWTTSNDFRRSIRLATPWYGSSPP